MTNVRQVLSEIRLTRSRDRLPVVTARPIHACSYFREVSEIAYSVLVNPRNSNNILRGGYDEPFRSAELIAENLNVIVILTTPKQ